MKKTIVFGLILLVFLSTSAFAIPDPSAVYCRESGYNYKIEKTGAGERGICVIKENVTEFDSWRFFEGNVGKEYSYCSKHGYDIEIAKDGKNSYSPEYAICVPKGMNKNKVAASDLMNLPKKIGKSFVSKATVSEQIIDPKLGEDEKIIAEQDIALPASFDWRNYNGYNWMTPVKDQGSCGSCWAFATVGSIEAEIKIKNNSIFDKDLSEQDLVSCFAGDGCNGIDDSEFPSLLAYVKSNGIVDELCFPYTATNQPCSNKCSDWENRLWHIDGYGVISNPLKVKDYLIEKGPIIALISMNGHWDSNGIYGCIGTPAVNHAIVIVGYNDTGRYWIAKNSWGSGWNGNGYFNVGYDECDVSPLYYTILSNIGNVSETNYCSVATKTYNQEYITRVNLNGNEKTSGYSNYSDFTGTIFTALSTGNNYTLYVDGNNTGNWTEYVRAWIDFNNDKAFSAGEEINLGYAMFKGKRTYSKNFTVPNNSIAGETRMRVYLKYGTAPNPCENASYGEVEDYKIGISSPQNNNLTSCAVLDKPGTTYYLKNDIIDSTNITCMNIVADSIALDCEGHIIDGIGSGYGAYSQNRNNITVKNCYVSNWSDGIHLEYSSNSKLFNNTANSNNDYGIIVYYSSNNIVSNNVANSNKYFNIRFLNSDNNTVYNNTVYNDIQNYTGYGIALGSSNNNIVYNNVANSSGDLGISLWYSHNNTVFNNTANLNGVGIYLYDSHNNTVFNNTANLNGGAIMYTPSGISLEYSSNNTINENVVCNNNNLDFNIISSTENSGSNNKCDNPDGWNDDGFVGCKYTCIPSPLYTTINSPLNSSVLNKSSVWFNVTTNRNSTCSYGEIRCQAFDGGGCSGTSIKNMSTTDGIHHSALVKSLSNTDENEWYELNATCTDYANISNSSSVKFFVNIVPLNEWSVDLLVISNGTQEGTLKFGMNVNATDLFDNGIDDTQPPAVPNGYDTYFSENEPTPKDRLSINIKALSGEKNWTLVFMLPKCGFVFVKWNSSAIDASTLLKIGEIDPESGQYIGEVLNMKYNDYIGFETSCSVPLKKTYKITSSKTAYKYDALNLKTGWNSVSIPYILENNSVENIFDSKVSSVWAYDNEVWRLWSPGLGGTLTEIKPGWGYWVSTDTDTTIGFEGVETSNHTIPLYEGWNLIGPTKPMQLPLSSPYVIGSIWAWTGSNYVSATDSLELKKAYWVAVSNDTILE